MENEEKQKDERKYKFDWKTKNGLKYVSDDMLKVAYALLEKGNFILEKVEENNTARYMLRSNVAGVCNSDITTKELLAALEKGENKLRDGVIFLTKTNTFSRLTTTDVGNVCTNCDFEKCPKHLAGYILYLRGNGLLEEKLKEREEFRKENKIHPAFDFVWNVEDGLKRVPEDVYDFCNELVNKGCIRVQTTLVDDKFVRIYSSYKCSEYKMINLDKTKIEPIVDRTYNKWKHLVRKVEHKMGYCDVYSCRLDMCPFEVAGYIYYLKKTGREDLIAEDRKYYNEHKEEMDLEVKKMKEQQIEQLKTNRENYIGEFQEYKIKNLEYLIDSLLNKSQTNLHCVVEGEDKDGKQKFINKILNTLEKEGKVKNAPPIVISLQNLAASNTYSLNTSCDPKYRDLKGTMYATNGAIKHTELEENRVYIITDVQEFINDYKRVKEHNNEALRVKQYEYAFDLLTKMSYRNFIIINSTQKEIDELLTLDQRLKFVYQNFRFEFPELSIDDMYNIYIQGIKTELVEDIRENYEKYKKQFKEYVSFNKPFMPFSNAELSEYLATYSNTKNKIVFPENLYKKETVDESLNNIVGMKNIKEKVKEFEKYMIFKVKAKSIGLKLQSTNMHMIFTGNPGTGKTTIARIMAKMLFDLGVIKENKLIEVERKDLIANYIGQTATKTSEVISRAMGGVLFIDEAYSLTPTTPSDYGYEAIATLIKAMEDHKDDLVVIFAGYKKEMQEFIKINSGIASRIGYTFDFQDYTDSELVEILYKKAEKCGMKIAEDAKPLIEGIMKYFESVENIGNGRFADKVLQEILVKHSKNEDGEIDVISKDDIPTINEMTAIIANGSNMIDPDKITSEDLKKTAIHEVGHAALRLILFKKAGIKRITINPEGTGTLGYVRYEKDNSSYTESKSKLLDYIKVGLAGMAAEQVYCGEFDNGNTSDLEHVTRVARNMITRYGMSKLGFGQIVKVEGEMAKIVHTEINDILNECYQDTLRIIEENKSKMDKVIDYLLEHKEINEEQFVENFK